MVSAKPKCDEKYGGPTTDDGPTVAGIIGIALAALFLVVCGVIVRRRYKWNIVNAHQADFRKYLELN